MTGPKQETITGEDLLVRLYSNDWFSGAEPKHIYLRYYSLPIEPTPSFDIPGLDGNDVVFAGTPFRIGIAHLPLETYEHPYPWLVSSKNGKNDVFVEIAKRAQPATIYVLISTPICQKGNSSWEEASLATDAFAGMLRTVGGNNLLREFVRETSVNVSDMSMRDMTRVVPVPLKCEGPFATTEVWQHQKDLLDFAALADDPRGQRVSLATQLIERAFFSSPSLKFLSYWTAIEVAADTHSTGKIITLLGKAYEKGNSYIQNDLGFDSLRNTRTAVFHDGERYELPSDVERYLQCLFLDAVRAKLKLHCRSHMAHMILAGFDVQRLDRQYGKPNILTVHGP